MARYHQRYYRRGSSPTATGQAAFSEGHSSPVLTSYQSRRPNDSAYSGYYNKSGISNAFNPQSLTPPSPSFSASFAVQRDGDSGPPYQSIADGSALEQNTNPMAALRRLDLEKQSMSDPSILMSQSHVTVIPNMQGEEEWNVDSRCKAIRFLLYMSGPCALVSIAILIWTLVSFFVVIALQPLRMCIKGKSFCNQLISFLSPALNLQLILICSAHSFNTHSAPCLVVVHMLSPLLACAVGFAAWIAASFWFFSAILGDPAGKDGYNDGRASVLGVRAWWERWLTNAFRGSKE